MAKPRALLVIDMQNDFCLPSSPLCVAGGAACVQKVIEVVANARSAGVQVIWVVRNHDASGVDIEWTRRHLITEGRGGGTVVGTPGAELVDGLTKAPGDLTVIKRRFSAFFGTTLDMTLRRLGVQEVILCGVQTPNCIRGTATDALALDYRPSVLSDATASKSDAVQEANLEDMRCMGIPSLTTAEWLQSLAGAQ